MAATERVVSKALVVDLAKLASDVAELTIQQVKTDAGRFRVAAQIHGKLILRLHVRYELFLIKGNRLLPQV